MKPAAAYIRVSTTPQETAQQRREILAAAKSRGFVISEWFEEKVKGKTLKRPELDRLRLAARTREVAVLFVWALDRLSRAGILDSLGLVKELDARGVQVVSLKDPIPEPGEPHRDLVLSVLFWVAEQESRRRSERLRAKMAELKARGVKLGRPRRYVDVARVAALRDAGRSWRSIAKALRCPKSVILRAWAVRNGGPLGTGAPAGKIPPVPPRPQLRKSGPPRRKP